MTYGIKRNVRYELRRLENNEELINSWINGNRMYVRAKFKAMRYENKGLFLQQAKESMSSEDYEDLQRGLYL